MKGRKCGLLLAVTKQIIRNNPCAHKWCCANYRVAVCPLEGQGRSRSLPTLPIQTTNRYAVVGAMKPLLYSERASITPTVTR